MDEYKYRTVFAAKIKALEPDDEVKQEAFASVKEAATSINNLKMLGANIDPEADPDLLYVVANLAVAGKVNLNDDALSTEDALAVYRKFEKKFVDIEHNRAHCVGFIVKAGLSEFGTDRILTEEEARELPYFNITTVSALWKSVNRPLCDLIIDASNPTSATYKDISLSFEVGFSDYEVGVGPRGERDLVNVKKTVKQGEEYESLSSRLRALGGNGLTEDGNDIVYRVLKGDIVPLGQGIVMVPAAQVKGMKVLDNEDDEMSEEEIESVLKRINEQFAAHGKTVEIVKKLAAVDENLEKSVNELAEVVAAVVQEKNIKTEDFSVSTVNTNKTMKYNTLEEIEKNWANIVKSEVASDVTFAGARELFTATILAESKKLADEAAINKNLIEQTKKDSEAAAAAKVEAEKALVEIKAELDAIKQKQAELEAEAAFNERMTAIAEEFDFSDEERAIIVKKIRNLSAEEYQTWSTEAKTMFKEKSKIFKKGKEAELKQAVKAGLEKAGVKAEVITEKLEKDIDFAEIFASVKVEDKAIDNTVDLSTKSIKDQMTAAFGNISFVTEKK